MPLVKFDYVVSFSSEDSEHKASNLLKNEIGKKYWLCGLGETSASVVLQLPRAIKISAVNVGVYHAALVEVLVGRSEARNEPYQVLVPSCMVLTASESRSADGLRRVRTFAGDALETSAAAECWDRVRVVCTQPYNKHCKFGLVFVHVFEGDDYKCEDNSILDGANQTMEIGKTNESTTEKDNSITIPMGDSSDEEGFKPGELFKQYLNASKKENQSIKQATMQVLNKEDKSAAKLVRTKLVSEPAAFSFHDQKKRSLDTTLNDSSSNSENTSNEKKRSWADFEPENMKIRNKADKRREETHKNRNDRANQDVTEIHDTYKKTVEVKTKKNKHFDEAFTPTRKKAKHNNKGSDLEAGPVSDNPHEILQGVVFALSGYENPHRGALRNAGLALGAKYEREYSDKCTHLICAFPNAPRLRAARASGSQCVAARGEWLEQQARLRRALPWQWFATEPSNARVPPKDYDRLPTPTDEDDDTDDDIAAVTQKQRKRVYSAEQHSDVKRQRASTRETDSKTHHKGTKTNKSSEEVDKIETDEDLKNDYKRTKSSDEIDGIKHESSDDMSTDIDLSTDINADNAEINDHDGYLPAMFDGLRFYVSHDLSKIGLDTAYVIRYVKAYGGLVIEDTDTDVDYILTCGQTELKGGLHLRPDWVWRCHETRSLAPTASFVL